MVNKISSLKSLHLFLVVIKFLHVSTDLSYLSSLCCLCSFFFLFCLTSCIAIWSRFSPRRPGFDYRRGMGTRFSSVQTTQVFSLPFLSSIETSYFEFIKVRCYFSTTLLRELLNALPLSFKRMNISNLLKCFLNSSYGKVNKMNLDLNFTYFQIFN